MTRPKEVSTSVRGLDIETSFLALAAWLVENGLQCDELRRKAVRTGIGLLAGPLLVSFQQQHTAYRNALRFLLAEDSDTQRDAISEWTTIRAAGPAIISPKLDRHAIFGGVVAELRRGGFTIVEAVELLDDGYRKTEKDDSAPRRADRARKKARTIERKPSLFGEALSKAYVNRISGTPSSPGLPTDSDQSLPSNADASASERTDAGVGGGGGDASVAVDNSGLDKHGKTARVETGPEFARSSERSGRVASLDGGNTQHPKGEDSAPRRAERPRPKTRRRSSKAAGVVKR